MSERLTQITVVEKPIHTLLPGEVTYEQATQTWYIGCPGEYDGTHEHRGAGSLGAHSVLYDAATEQLTVSPSILCYKCEAHYFVEQSKIRWV